MARARLGRALAASPALVPAKVLCVAVLYGVGRVEFARSVNDRNFLLRGALPELEFTHDDRLPRRFGQPKESGGEYRLASIPNLEGTISDIGILFQLRPDFRTRLDIRLLIAVRGLK